MTSVFRSVNSNFQMSISLEHVAFLVTQLDERGNTVDVRIMQVETSEDVINEVNAGNYSNYPQYKYQGDNNMEITMAKKSWDIEASIKYTEGDIDDIIVGAFEGGINYWASVGPVFACGTPIREDKPENLATSEWFTKMLLGGKGIVIMDNEDASELGVLTLAKVLKGIKMNHKFNIDKDTFDSEDYDRIIQFGLLGEIVYG